jgi:hypothetical protein
MNSTEPEGAELLEAYRQTEGIARARVDRIYGRLQLSVPTDLSAPTSQGALARAKHGWWKSVKLWLGLTTIAVPVAYVTLTNTEPRVELPRSSVVAPPTQPAALANEPSVSHVDAATAAPVVTKPPAAKPPKKGAKGALGSRQRVPTEHVPVPSPTPSVPDSVTIDAEVAALRDANLLLRTHKPRDAVYALDAMDQKFGAGSLADARVLTRVLALCALGDGAAAQRAAEAFLRAHPGSPYTDRMRNACPVR